MISKSTTEDINQFIQQNSSWEIKNEKLCKVFVFKNFIQAFGFMTQSAIIAERDNHHPEWSNVYKTVVVELTTHEANGITERDFSLAKSMDNIASTI